MFDSVFSPFVFARPVLSLPERDRLESVAAAAMTDALATAAEVWLESLNAAITSGDMAALGQSSWAARIPLELAIFQLWGDGFWLGEGDGIAEMQSIIGPVQASGGPYRFSRDEGLAIFELEPRQLINTDALDAVRARANLSAGNFSADVFEELKGHVAAAIAPQAETGEPISRPQLLERIQGTLGVSEARAKNIARTELTYAYNDGRMASFDRSTLVDYYRIIAIDDSRTTEICRDRNGLVLTRDELEQIGGVPPYHYQCRTTVSPVMSRIRRGRELVENPANQLANRQVRPLMDGWSIKPLPPLPQAAPPIQPPPQPPAQTPEELAQIVESGLGVPGYSQHVRDWEDKFSDPSWVSPPPPPGAYELAGVTSYTSDEYFQINALLRGQTSKLTAYNTRDREGIKAAAELADRALSQLPQDVFQGTVYRGTRATPERLAQYSPGATVTELGFTSTSKGIDNTDDFRDGIFFRIQSKQGIYVRRYSIVKDEEEVLFRPGTRFRVLSNQKIGNEHLIELEEV